MSTEIMISYASEDVGSAGQLRENLEAHFGSEAVFMDKGRLHGGANFPAMIAEAIRESSVVIAVVTPENWSKDFGREDDWVRRELREALAAGVPVLPVRMHGAPPPGAELPPDLAPLAEVHAIAIDDEDFADDVRRLVEDLERFVAPPAPPGAFPEVEERGRAEVRAAWKARISLDRAERLVREALKATAVEVGAAGDGGACPLTAGSRWKFRALGVLMAPKRSIPVRGLLRVTGGGSTATIELLLDEDLGASLVVGARNAYGARFEEIVDAVKAATSAR